MMEYEEFLLSKTQYGQNHGFDIDDFPSYLFDFQKELVHWALLKGKGAIFADCGLGKTPMQLVWADKIVKRENKPVLILTPLAVSYQTLREGEKFGIECRRSNDGKVAAAITVTNYEQLSKFNQSDFIGVVCDESSILKNFDGVRKAAVTEFLRRMPYRLLCTATAAPNDYIELGTASEALGELGYMDMLTRFFKNSQGTSDTKRRWAFRNDGGLPQWRFKKHAEQPFWRWICSWAKALRRPSDLGFEDRDFILPELIERQVAVDFNTPFPGELFPKVAIGLHEQRVEKRATIEERCEKVAELVGGQKSALSWCDLNDEGDLLEKIIPGGVQISGQDPDECKEEKFLGFVNKQIRVLICKPRIGAYGLNLQHCNFITFFPSHSFEQYYQGVRRCWRFGQKNAVTVSIVVTPGTHRVLANLQRKAKAADEMFTALVSNMKDAVGINRGNQFSCQEEVPPWL